MMRYAPKKIKMQKRGWKMRLNFILPLILLTFMSACFLCKKTDNSIKYTGTIDSLEYKLSLWKIDSLGCLKYRSNLGREFTFNLGRYIQNDSNLALILLGKPNLLRRSYQIEYIYYTGSICEKNQINRNFRPQYFIVSYDSLNNFNGIDRESHE